MINAKEAMIQFIKSQKSLEEFARKVNITRQTLHSVTVGRNVSSEVVAKLLNESGFDFEKAFEVQESTESPKE